MWQNVSRHLKLKTDLWRDRRRKYMHANIAVCEDPPDSMADWLELCRPQAKLINLGREY